MASRHRFRTIAAVVSFALANGTGAALPFAPGFGPCSITIAVRDAAGLPVARAIVDADGPTQRTAETSAAGVVTFAAVPAGHYVVRARSLRARSTVESVSVVQTMPGTTGSSRALQFVALQLEPDSVGGSMTQQGTPYLPASLAEPMPAFELARDPHVDVSALGERGAIRVNGGDPRELRERVDGIPLPDAVRGSLVLFGAPALAASYSLAGGTAMLGARPDPGVGGLVELSTQPLGATSRIGVAAGSTDRGVNAALALDRQAGPFAAGVRLGTDANGVRARALDARVALSPATVVDAEAYRLDDRDGLATGPYDVEVRAASFATSLGAARLGVQSYDSAFTADGAADDRLHGIALHYDGTFGPTGLDLSYVRESEFARYGDGTSAGSSESRFGLRNVYALSTALRAEVQYSRGNGTLIGARNDLGTTLGLQLAPGWLLRLATSSGVAPAPLDLVAREPFAAIATPETAFESSATVRYARGIAAFDVEAFRTREAGRFAALSDATSSGASFRYAVAPLAGLGFDLTGGFARVREFGTATPQRDSAATPLAAVLGISEASADLAALRGGAALSFTGRSGLGVLLGATYLDAPNALAPTALVLGKVSLHVPFSRGPSGLAMRLSTNDVLGGPFRLPSTFTMPDAARQRRDVELMLERPSGP